MNKNIARRKSHKGGRQPLKDKKERIVLYIRQSVIDLHGGSDAMRKYFYSKVK